MRLALPAAAQRIALGRYQAAMQSVCKQSTPVAQ
jgi:hypothetical protein